jgi:hypothetical protein
MDTMRMRSVSLFKAEFMVRAGRKVQLSTLDGNVEAPRNNIVNVGWTVP